MIPEPESLSPSAIMRLNVMIDQLQQEESEGQGVLHQKDLDDALCLLGEQTNQLESFGSSAGFSSGFKSAECLPNSNLQGKRFLDPVLIGVGAYALVFRVFDTALQIPVALKVLKSSKVHSQEFQARFLGEAQSTAQLSHPGIIRIFDTGRIGNLLFISCEYAPKGSLGDWLKNKSELMSEEQAASLMCRVAEAVHYAHSKLTLHRDIKPGNILLFEEPQADHESDGFAYRPVLTDFGLCKQIGAVSSDWTTEGVIVGTARYMSPEQASGCPEDLRTTTDVYSMGVVLYQLLTGRVPFDADFENQIRNLVRTSVPVRPSMIREGLSRDLDAIVMKCLAKDPEHRYQTAREFQADLKRFLAGQNISARKLSFVRSSLRTIRRYPLTTALTTLLFATNFVALALISKSRNEAIEASNETIQVIGKMHNAFGDAIIERTLISPAQFEEKLAESIACVEDWMDRYGETESSLHTLSVLQHYSSLCHYLMGQVDQGVKDRSKVIESQRRLLVAKPGNRKLRFQMATSFFHLACGLSKEKPDRLERSLEALELARREVEVLISENPGQGDENYWLESIDLRNAIDRQRAELLMDEDPAIALQIFERVVESAANLFVNNPGRPMFLTHAIFALRSESTLFANQKQDQKRVQAFADAERLALERWEGHWDKGWPTRQVSQLYFEWTMSLYKRRQFAEALLVLNRWRTFHQRIFPFAIDDNCSPMVFDKYSTHYSILGLIRHATNAAVGSDTNLPIDQGLDGELIGAAARLVTDEEKIVALRDELALLGVPTPELISLLAKIRQGSQ
ncbi:MAG: serine/threonine protein kinase [Planctomycetota bacterium]